MRKNWRVAGASPPTVFSRQEKELHGDRVVLLRHPMNNEHSREVTVSVFVVLGMFIYVLTRIYLLFIPRVLKNMIETVCGETKNKDTIFFYSCSITTSNMYFGP